MHMFPIRPFVGFVAKFNRTTTGQIGKCNATPPDNNNMGPKRTTAICLLHSRPFPSPPIATHSPATTPFVFFVLIDEWRGQSIKWPATTQICLRIQIQLQNTPTLCYPPETPLNPPSPTPFLTLFEVFRSCKVADVDVVLSMTLSPLRFSLSLSLALPARSHCHLNSDQLTFSEPFAVCVCGSGGDRTGRGN